jgi:hypothetical protein
MPCTVCHLPVDEPGLVDPATGNAFHPDCAIERLPAELAVASAELLATALVPIWLLWAG